MQYASTRLYIISGEQPFLTMEYFRTSKTLIDRVKWEQGEESFNQ
jgi:hypothetical protein